LTKEFDYIAFRTRYGPAAMPLFVVDPGGTLAVWTADQPLTPRPGQLLMSLVDPVEEDTTPVGRTPALSETSA